MSDIKEWLAEYKTLHDGEVTSYSARLRKNENLIKCLFEFLESTGHSQQELDPVCHQLFEFYRSDNTGLQYFTRELVPSLIYHYVRNLHTHQNYSGLETCLLGIYNLNINRESKPRVLTIPTLAKPSIYHEPAYLGTLTLTESALSGHKGEPLVLATGPNPQVERINSQNRYSILTGILQSYNDDICSVRPRSHEALCLLASRISKDGFGSSPDVSRIMMNGKFMVELLHGVYYVMFNSHSRLGIQAIEDIHSRASYEMLPDVLLVTNAIINSLESRSCEDSGPMGISIALSPSSSYATCTQAAITNATFKTAKLPDDISIPEEDEVPDQMKSANDKPEKTASLTNRITKQFSKKLEKSFKPKKDGVSKKSEENTVTIKHGKDLIEMNNITIATGDYHDGEETEDGASSIVTNGITDCEVNIDEVSGANDTTQSLILNS